MSLQPILDKLPDYARDLKVNLQNVLQQQELTPQQTWMSAVACAIASRNKELTDAVVATATPQISPEALNAGRVAGAVMGMNNVFYRFRHFIQSKPRIRSGAGTAANADDSHARRRSDRFRACLSGGFDNQGLRGLR